MSVFRFRYCFALSLWPPSQTTRTLIVLSRFRAQSTCRNPAACSLHDVWQLTSLREPPSSRSVQPEAFRITTAGTQVEAEAGTGTTYCVSCKFILICVLIPGPWRAIRGPVEPPDATMSSCVPPIFCFPFPFFCQQSHGSLPAPSELTHHSETCPASHWLFPCTPCLLSLTFSQDMTWSVYLPKSVWQGRHRLMPWASIAHSVRVFSPIQFLLMLCSFA